jgi:mono/diheme cytochrome c family protein
MLNTRLARPALAMLAVAAIGACSKSSTTASTTPSPASAPASATSAASAPAAAARPFTAAMVAEGDSIFHARSCKNCHGPDGKGAANGPNLTGPTFLHVDGSFDSFVHLITTGVPADQIKDPAHKIPMGARGGRGGPLSDDQIKAVAAYVFTLSHH